MERGQTRKDVLEAENLEFTNCGFVNHKLLERGGNMQEM